MSSQQNAVAVRAAIAMDLVPDCFQDAFEEFCQAWAQIHQRPISPNEAVSQLLGFALHESRATEELIEQWQDATSERDHG